MQQNNTIYIKGARVNNLKNIDLSIPRDQLVVITGLSGSGKSSLAFDTLYAEGQRRYVESLSAYARQFLGRMGKPECDYILGIPPAVAIEQKVIVRNPRSTVGTSTEIYDYLRLLFARVGRTYSPVSGEWVKKHTTDDVVRYAESLPDGTRVALMVQMQLPAGRTLSEHVEVLTKSGFSRAEVGGRFVRLDEVTEAPFHLVIDRLALPLSDAATQSRMADSVETAFYEGEGECLLAVWLPDSVSNAEAEALGGGRHYERTFSKRFEADGITFEEPSEMMFNFNNPIGACPTCEGFGRVLGIDEELVIPNKSLSLYEDCVACWRGEKMSEWKNQVIAHAAEVDFPIHRPYYQLTQQQRDQLWHGCDAFYGIDDFFRMVSENLYKIQYRVMQSRYRGKTICPTCLGGRLKKEALYVRVGDSTITDLVRRSVDELIPWFAELTLEEHDATIARRLLTEIRTRLGFLHDVGLGYLTLDRLSNTLSGGESQRINLATSLGSALVGSMYILDEPSIGLHPRDTDRLIGVLRKLRDLGNTVIVVEHDEEIIHAADYLIDIGPEAGCNGGEVVFSGTQAEIATADGSRSHTVRFLRGEEQVELPLHPRPWSSYIEVQGAVANNLKQINVRFPIGVMTVVTGVSGSGKSTLVRDLLYRGMMRHLGLGGDAPGAFAGLGGDVHRIRRVEMVDQNPIGKSSRSNAATYMKAYDEIRRLYADQPYARQLGFTPATFSFNVEGGRCEECKGEGTITVEMQFMADLVIECEACHGRRFNSDVLEVRYKGKNIADALDLSVDEAISFFADDPRIVARLLPLQQVGLGYIKLGQSSSTLSGGENQRVKLAYYLAYDDELPTLFIFDEPTTGLHIHDVRVLLRAFNSLVDKGHTLVVIEHNLDVIKCADHIIDLGPEGGDGGGQLVAQGTPAEVAACDASYTGRYLRDKLSVKSVAKTRPSGQKR
jgi:excinuclease ABC subunit A